MPHLSQCKNITDRRENKAEVQKKKFLKLFHGFLPFPTNFLFNHQPTVLRFYSFNNLTSTLFSSAKESIDNPHLFNPIRGIQLSHDFEYSISVYRTMPKL